MPAASVCHKSRIAQQFSRAAKSYDSGADVQKEIAADALAYLPSSGQVLLDIGCGTGRNSPKLATKCQRLIALDLAFGMLTYAQHNTDTADKSVHWFQGDAEHLPLQSRTVDRVFSSMVMQRCNQPQQVMSEMNRVMISGAQAVLAIMCDGSFKQLQHSWQQVDRDKHVNDFASAKIWQDAALKLGLQVHISTKQYVTWHTNLRQLLASIKSIGANIVLPSEHSGLAKQTSFNRHTVKKVETIYRDLFAENGQLPLTYQVCYLHCIKP